MMRSKGTTVACPVGVGETHNEQNPPLQIEAWLDQNAEFMEFLANVLVTWECPTYLAKECIQQEEFHLKVSQLGFWWKIGKILIL